MVNKINKFVFILLTLAFFATTIKAEKTAEKLVAGNVNVYHESADSLYAQQAATTIHRYYEEIANDLQIDNPDSLYIYIAPSRKDFRNYLRGQLPHWTGAFATPGKYSMYIRSPRWDKDSDFKATIIHELFHLLVHHKMKNTAIPRWMDEGLAIFYSGEQRWITGTALSKALATNSLIPLAQVEQVLKFHRAKAELAYQTSYSAVHYLLTVYDIDAVRTILDGLAAGQDLDTCFINATGSPFHTFEKEWITSAKKQYKWFWLSDLNDYLWILIIIIFLTVGIYIRFRNRKKLLEWEKETDLE